MGGYSVAVLKLILEQSPPSTLTCPSSCAFAAPHPHLGPPSPPVPPPTPSASAAPSALVDASHAAALAARRFPNLAIFRSIFFFILCLSSPLSPTFARAEQFPSESMTFENELFLSASFTFPYWSLVLLRRLRNGHSQSGLAGLPSFFIGFAQHHNRR